MSPNMSQNNINKSSQMLEGGEAAARELKTITQEDVAQEDGGATPAKTPPKNNRTRNNDNPLSETPGPSDSVLLDTMNGNG